MKTRNKKRSRGDPITNFLKRNSDFSDVSEIEKRSRKARVEKKRSLLLKQSSSSTKALLVKKKLQSWKPISPTKKSTADNSADKKSTTEKTTATMKNIVLDTDEDSSSDLVSFDSPEEPTSKNKTDNPDDDEEIDFLSTPKKNKTLKQPVSRKKIANPFLKEISGGKVVEKKPASEVVTLSDEDYSLFIMEEKKPSKKSLLEMILRNNSETEECSSSEESMNPPKTFHKELKLVSPNKASEKTEKSPTGKIKSPKKNETPVDKNESPKKTKTPGEIESESSGQAEKDIDEIEEVSVATQTIATKPKIFRILPNLLSKKRKSNPLENKAYKYQASLLKAPESNLKALESVPKASESVLKAPESGPKPSESVLKAPTNEPKASESDLKVSERDGKAPENDLKVSESGHKAPENDPKALESDPKASESGHKAPENDLKASESDHKVSECDHKVSESDHKAPTSEPKASESVFKAPESGTKTSLISVVPKETGSSEQQAYKILLSPSHQNIGENDPNVKLPTLVPIKVMKPLPAITTTASVTSASDTKPSTTTTSNISVSTVPITLGTGGTAFAVVPTSTNISMGVPTKLVKSPFATNFVPVTNTVTVSTKSPASYPPLILIPGTNSTDQSINALLQNPNFVTSLQQATNRGNLVFFKPPGSEKSGKFFKRDGSSGNDRVKLKPIRPAATITTTANTVPLVCVSEMKSASKADGKESSEDVTILEQALSKRNEEDCPNMVEIRTVSSNAGETLVKRVVTETSKVEVDPSISAAAAAFKFSNQVSGPNILSDGKPYFVKKQTVYLPANGSETQTNQTKKSSSNQKRYKGENAADGAAEADLSKVVKVQSLEIKSLTNENKKLRALNMSLQEKLKMMYQMSLSQQRQEETLLRIMDILPMLQAASKGEVPIMPVGSPVYPPVSTLINNEVHLGQGVWLAKREFDRVMNIATTPSLLVRNLGVAVYGEEVLKNSSVLGKPCMRFTKRTSRPPLSPTRFTAIRETFDFWLSKHGFTGQRKLDELSHTTQYLGSKIQDLNRPDHLKFKHKKISASQGAPDEGGSEGCSSEIPLLDDSFQEEMSLAMEEASRDVEGTVQVTSEPQPRPKPKAKKRKAAGDPNKKKRETKLFSVDPNEVDSDLLDNWKSSMFPVKQEPTDIASLRKPDLAVQAFLESLTRDLERPDTPE